MTNRTPLSSLACWNYQRQIIPYLEGALSPARRSALAHHAAGCVNCKRELRALQQASGIIRGAAGPVPQPAPELWQRIEARVHDVQLSGAGPVDGRQSGAGPAAGRKWALSLGGGVAGTFALAAAGLLVMNTVNHRGHFLDVAQPVSPSGVRTAALTTGTVLQAIPEVVPQAIPTAKSGTAQRPGRTYPLPANESPRSVKAGRRWHAAAINGQPQPGREDRGGDTGSLKIARLVLPQPDSSTFYFQDGVDGGRLKAGDAVTYRATSDAIKAPPRPLQRDAKQIPGGRVPRPGPGEVSTSVLAAVNAAVDAGSAIYAVDSDADGAANSRDGAVLQNGVMHTSIVAPVQGSTNGPAQEARVGLTQGQADEPAEGTTFGVADNSFFSHVESLDARGQPMVTSQIEGQVDAAGVMTITENKLSWAEESGK